MTDIVLTTFDWVPEFPRGYIRDLRVRWALEEAHLPYRVESVPFRDRGPEHFARQPFGQVPWITDGNVMLFESGAILLHVAEKSESLMPPDSEGRAEVIQWLFAALNSVEMPAVPWTLFRFAQDSSQSPGRLHLDAWLNARLDHMEAVLSGRVWLAGEFSVADLAMSDVLRLLDRCDALATRPACRAYVARATSRPAFQKAHADQLAHFAAADRAA